MSIARSGGGAATQAGINYQNRVAAWIAVSILAEQDVAPPWILPAHVTLIFLRCETEQPVDDLLVGTSDGGHVFIQVKHRLTLGTDAQSGFGSTIDQFVRQFLAHRDVTLSKRPWERPLDADRDRLVLVTSSGSSAPIREDLPNLLAKIPELSSDQAIGNAASNSKKAQEVLDTVITLIRNAWRNVRESEPTDSEMRQILRLIRVQVLDVDAGGSEELQAKDRLRASVLAQPTQADAAWTSLIQICADLAVNQSGADQASLQTRLLQNGISLKPTRSYQEDIERLRQYSHASAGVLSELSEIKVGSKTVKINRPVTQALQATAKHESLLVIGEPGAGKSGTIYDFVKALNNEKRDVVFLAVDRLEADTPGGLRDDLGLEHTLDEILRQWQGSESGWLVIDALDAARSARSVKTFRDLLATTIKASGRWRVVASIRKFDLRYSPELQQLFRGRLTAPDCFRDNEFSSIRHLNVPVLNDEELEQIRPQSKLLADFVSRTEERLRKLLRVPFNLRLMGDLIGAEVNPESLAPIQTQIELLDRYWQERLVHSNDPSGDAHEAVLRRTVEKMVETRSLRVNRSDVLGDITTSATISPLLDKILRSHILTEWQPSKNAKFERSILTFAHHVLFDYAVARLILRGLPQNTIERLEREFDLVLAIRPSLVFHFQHLWFFEPSRNLFWELVLQILRTPAIPEIGKLLGPSVAADLIQNLSDCELLFEILETATPSSENSAVYRALSHLVGAILVDPSRADRPLAGSDAPPWCELIERCSQSIDLPLFRAVRPLVWNICEQSDKFTPTQLQIAGIAARRFFDFAWKEDISREHFISRELEALCRTFASDPAESAKLLRQLLEPSAMQAYGFTSMFWLADQVKYLIPYDAELVAEIYRATFTHQETSDAPTYLGGIISSGISNRQQDFELALYNLAESYSQFLEQAPAQATYALVGVMEGYVEQSHPIRQVIENKFDFDGQEAVITTDYSAIWDSPTYRYDDPLKILDTFTEYLQNLSKDTNRTDERQSLIHIIVTENRLAILWRCLLKCGIAAPKTLGQEICFLCWAIPILTAYDTTTLAGDFLQVVFSDLSYTDRERVEQAILSIPNLFGDGVEESSQHIRNRLLGCLPPEALVTQESKKILNELTSQGELPPNEPLFRLDEFTVTPYGEQEYLSDLGVPIKAEQNHRIQVLEEPIKEFSEKYLNSLPDISCVEAIFPTLQSLYEALKSAETDGVHPKQRDYAWGKLAEACERITKLETLSCETDVGVFVKQILLEASEHPDPIHYPESEKHFDESPSWGSPAARLDAAEGLTRLARHANCLDEDVLKVIERLSCDPVPAVRYQVACSILAMYQTAPELMWSIVTYMSCEETSRGVLQGLLPSLSCLGGTHGERVAELTKVVFSRIIDGSGAGKVREYCTSIFTGLHLWQNNSIADEVVHEIANHPTAFHKEAQKIVVELRECLTIGLIQAADPLEEQVRQRAFALMGQILNSTLRALKELQINHQQTPFESWSEEEQEIVKNLIQVANAITMQIFFASGAFDEQRSSRKPSAAALGIPGKQRFLKEANFILDGLSTLGFPRAVHHLLKTLVFLVDVAPQAIFLRVGQVVRSSKSGSYQYDSLGADLIVRFIERFLAEYRYILREDEAPVHSLAEGTIRFLDYFGMDGGTGKALLIVETKRPSSPLPLPKRKRVVHNDKAFESFIGNALIGEGNLTQEWQEWLETLRDYVKSIQAKSGNCPRRVVITNGDWLVLFTNHEDAFLSSYPNKSEIFVYPNQHKIQESAYEIFDFLEYHSVLGKTPPLSLGEISFYLRPEQLERAMFGLRLMYFEEPEFYYETSPAVKVVPVVFLRSKQGVWFCVEAQNHTHTQRIPSKSEFLLTHLKTVNQIAKNLLDTINSKLGITLSCSSLAEHYASHDLFDELPGVVKLPGKYEEFLIVTGSYTHYLLEEPTIPDCPYHFWDNSDAEGYAAGSHPVKRPSVNAPRTIFVTDVQHHCSHRDVKLAKSSQITLENRRLHLGAGCKCSPALISVACLRSSI